MVRRAFPAPSPQHHVPVRTCVGCRQRVVATELLRVAVVARGDTLVVVPDLARRLSGRGAHLHPVWDCLALAERRRSFGRALRVAGVLDTGSLHEYVNGLGSTDGADQSVRTRREVGRPGMSTR